jgi:transposase
MGNLQRGRNEGKGGADQVVEQRGGEAMSAPMPVQAQLIGGLPVVQALFDRLTFADIIDRVVPWQGEVPLGVLAEVLVANRLLGPKPLYRLGEWAARAGLTDFYQLRPEQLNDDLFGRALERLAEHAHDAEAALVLRAVQQFDLDLAQVHYDITSVELFGAYQGYADPPEPSQGQQPAPDYQPPRPAYGRSKSGRKNLKQVQRGLDVLGDGAVPVGHAVLDGNTAEVATHQANLKRLKEVLPTSRFLLITDSKGDTQENLLRIEAAGCEFLCTGAFTEELQQRYLRLRDKMHKIAYHPRSQEKRPPEDRDEYKAHEVTERLCGEVDGRKVRLRYRLIFVYSQARALQQRQSRERHTGRIREEFEKVERNLNRYKLKTQQAIVARLEKAKGRYAEGALFRYEPRGQEGRFELSWRLDEEEQRRWQELEGVYVLKANRKRSAHPVAEVIRTYKEQSHVERRISHVKGPLAVTPAFPEKPQRIAGLLAVVVWSLLILALLQRQVRRGLGGKPMFGLYPEGRPCPAPSGPTILGCFETLCVVVFLGAGGRRQLAQLSAVQGRLLGLLGILETDLRCYARCASP